MPNSPDQLTVVATQTIVGGAIAVFSVWLTNRANTSRERLKLDHDEVQRKSQLLRERGEELYVLIDTLLNAEAAYYIGIKAVMQRKLTYNKCLEMEIEGRKESPVNFSRVELLVDVYFPSINEVFAQTQSERDKFHNIAQEHKRAYENGDLDGRRFLLPFGEAMKSIDEIGSHLLKAVVECIRTVAC